MLVRKIDLEHLAVKIMLAVAVIPFRDRQLRLIEIDRKNSTSIEHNPLIEVEHNGAGQSRTAVRPGY